MAQNNQQNPAPRQAIADENTITIYGMTVGELVRQGQKDLEAAKQQVADRETMITEKEKEIVALRKELLTEKEKPPMSAEQVKKAIVSLEKDRGMQKLPDGSVRLLVTVPADSAATFLAWASDAREDPAQYIGKQVEEALLAYSMS